MDAGLLSADGKVLCFRPSAVLLSYYHLHPFQEHNGTWKSVLAFYFDNSAHDQCFRGFVLCFCFIEDLLNAKAKPPSENEFVDAFQKFKYSFSLLVSRYNLSVK